MNNPFFCVFCCVALGRKKGTLFLSKELNLLQGASPAQPGSLRPALPYHASTPLINPLNSFTTPQGRATFFFPAERAPFRSDRVDH